MIYIECHILIDMLRLLLRGHGLTLTMVCLLLQLRKMCLNLILVFMKFIEVDYRQLEFICPPIPECCDHSLESCNGCWRGYPQARFPNWTNQQIRKAKIYESVNNSPENKHCICYRVDLNDQGFFTSPKEMTIEYGEEERIWDNMIHEQVSLSRIFLHKHSIFFQRPSDTRLRALFIQDLSGPVLQMLGTKYLFSIFLPSSAYITNKPRYNIEPFFWSSSFNWIPSHFQEEIMPSVGDRESGLSPGL